MKKEIIKVTNKVLITVRPAVTDSNLNYNKWDYQQVNR